MKDDIINILKIFRQAKRSFAHKAQSAPRRLYGGFLWIRLKKTYSRS